MEACCSARSSVRPVTAEAPNQERRLAGGAPAAVVRAVRVWEWQPPPSCSPAPRDRSSRTPCREATILDVSDRPWPLEVQPPSSWASTSRVSDEPDYLTMSQYHCSPSRLPEPSRLRRHGCPPCNFPASAMPCLSPASCAEEPSQRPASGPRRPSPAPLRSHPRALAVRRTPVRLTGGVRNLSPPLVPASVAGRWDRHARGLQPVYPAAHLPAGL